MGSPRSFTRVFASLWAVLQFALPMATLYADAVDARATTDRYVIHVEDAANAGCRPVHAEECALCRFLSNSSAPIARADVSLLLRHQSSMAIGTARIACVAPARGLPSSRAPPIV